MEAEVMLHEESAEEQMCDLCKISYLTKQELKDHDWSFMHHIKMEQKKKGSIHTCSLCMTTSPNIIEYGKHLNGEKHKKAVEEGKRQAEEYNMTTQKEALLTKMSREKEESLRVQTSEVMETDGNMSDPEVSRRLQGSRGKKSAKGHQRSFSQPYNNVNRKKTPKGKKGKHQRGQVSYQDDFHDNQRWQEDSYQRQPNPNSSWWQEDIPSWENFNRQSDFRNYWENPRNIAPPNYQRWYDDRNFQQQNNSRNARVPQRYWQDEDYSRYSDRNEMNARHNPDRDEMNARHSRNFDNEPQDRPRHYHQDDDYYDNRSRDYYAGQSYDNDFQGNSKQSILRRERHDDVEQESRIPDEDDTVRRSYTKMGRYRDSIEGDNDSGNFKRRRRNDVSSSKPRKEVRFDIPTDSSVPTNINEQEELGQFESVNPNKRSKLLNVSQVNSTEADSTTDFDGKEKVSGNSKKGGSHVMDKKRIEKKKKKKNWKKSLETSLEDVTQPANEDGLSVLERAEKLCKELREKREQAKKEKDRKEKQNKMSKTEELNSQIKNLSEINSGYVKGHLTAAGERLGDIAADIDTHKALLLKEKTKDCKMQEVNTSETSSKKSFAKPSGSKTEHAIDEIRQGIEKSVRMSWTQSSVDSESTKTASSAHIAQFEKFSKDDNVPMPSRVTKKKQDKRSSLEKDNNSEDVLGLDLDNLTNWPNDEVNRIENTESSPGDHSGVNKESLLKLVNSPRSRKERQCLAEMLRSYASSKSKLSFPRFNIQLSDVTAGIDEVSQELRLEDLSADVQLQIANLIEQDLKPDMQTLEKTLFTSNNALDNLDGPSAVRIKVERTDSPTRDLNEAFLNDTSSIENPFGEISRSVDPVPYGSIQNNKDQRCSQVQSHRTVKPSEGRETESSGRLTDSLEVMSRSSQYKGESAGIGTIVSMNSKLPSSLSGSEIQSKSKELSNIERKHFHGESRVESNCSDDKSIYSSRVSRSSSDYQNLKNLLDKEDSVGARNSSKDGLKTTSLNENFVPDLPNQIATRKEADFPVSSVVIKKEPEDDNEYPGTSKSLSDTRSQNEVQSEKRISQSHDALFGLKAFSGVDKDSVPYQSVDDNGEISDSALTLAALQGPSRDSATSHVKEILPSKEGGVYSQSLMSSVSSTDSLFFDTVYDLSVQEEDIRKQMMTAGAEVTRLSQLIQEASHQLKLQKSKLTTLAEKEENLRSQRLRVLKEARQMQSSSQMGSSVDTVNSAHLVTAREPQLHQTNRMSRDSEKHTSSSQNSSNVSINGNAGPTKSSELSTIQTSESLEPINISVIQNSEFLKPIDGPVHSKTASSSHVKHRFPSRQIPEDRSAFKTPKTHMSSSADHSAHSGKTVKSNPLTSRIIKSTDSHSNQNQETLQPIDVSVIQNSEYLKPIDVSANQRTSLGEKGASSVDSFRLGSQPSASALSSFEKNSQAPVEHVSAASSGIHSILKKPSGESQDMPGSMSSHSASQSLKNVEEMHVEKDVISSAAEKQPSNTSTKFSKQKNKYSTSGQFMPLEPDSDSSDSTFKFEQPSRVSGISSPVALKDKKKEKQIHQSLPEPMEPTKDSQDHEEEGRKETNKSVDLQEAGFVTLKSLLSQTSNESVSRHSDTQSDDSSAKVSSPYPSSSPIPIKNILSSPASSGNKLNLQYMGSIPSAEDSPLSSPTSSKLNLQYMGSMPHHVFLGKDQTVFQALQSIFKTTDNTVTEDNKTTDQKVEQGYKSESSFKSDEIVLETDSNCESVGGGFASNAESLGEKITQYCKRNTRASVKGGKKEKTSGQVSDSGSDRTLKNDESNSSLTNTPTTQHNVSKLMSINKLSDAKPPQPILTDSPSRKKRKTRKQRNQTSTRKQKEEFILRSTSDGSSGDEEPLSSLQQRIQFEASQSKENVDGSQDDEICLVETGSDDMEIVQEPPNIEEPTVPQETVQPHDPSNSGIRRSLLDEVDLDTESDICTPRQGERFKMKPEMIALVRDSIKKRNTTQWGDDVVRMEGRPEPVAATLLVGKHVVVAFQNASPQKFDIESGKSVGVFDCQSHKVCCLGVAKNIKHENVLYAGGPSKVIYLFDFDRMIPLKTENVEYKIQCMHLQWGRIYIGTDHGDVIAKHTSYGKTFEVFNCDSQPITCIASASEGMRKVLLVAAFNSSIYVNDAISGLLLRVLNGHSKNTSVFSIFVDGHVIYSGSGDKTLKENDLLTGELIHSYSDSQGVVTGTVAPPGQEFVYSAGYDKMIRCYHKKTHKLHCQYYGADFGIITTLAVEDNKLITGNREGVIEVMNISPEDQVYTCMCFGCGLRFGAKHHLLHHIKTQHLSNTRVIRCKWEGCFEVMSATPHSKYKDVDTHLKTHIESSDR